VFAQISETKFSTETIQEKMVKVINALAGDSNTEPVVRDAISKLSAILQSKLQELMEGKKN